MRTPPDERAHWDAAKLFLLLLLVADVMFIGLHLVRASSITYLQDPLYSIETDGGFSEWFQYIKEGWVALLFFALWKRTGSIFHAGWAFLFVYFLLDDSVQIHELGGESISRHLGYKHIFGLRPQDLGELSVAAVVGMVVLLTIAFTYPRAPRNDKHVSHDIGFLVVLLVIAGVGVDMVHSVVFRESQNEALKVGLAILEDGAELVIMSLSVWYASSLLMRDGVASEERVWKRIPRLWSSTRAASGQSSTGAVHVPTK